MNTDLFADTTAGAYEPPPVLFIKPPRERQPRRLLRFLRMTMMRVFALTVLRAAMFAEPAIPQVEKMGGLVHRISAATQETPSSALEPTLVCHPAKSGPAQSRRSDVCRERGTDRQS